MSLLSESNTWFEYESLDHELTNYEGSWIHNSIGIGPGSSIVYHSGSTALIRSLNLTTGERLATLITGGTEEEFVRDFCIADSSTSFPVNLMRIYGYPSSVVGVQISIRPGDVPTSLRAHISANRQLMRVPIALLQQIHGYMGDSRFVDYRTMRPYLTNCAAIRASLPTISVSFTEEFNTVLGILLVRPEEYTRLTDQSSDTCELLVTSSDGPDMFINLLMIPDINIRSANNRITICDSLDF
jgi:hypothetical protein